MRDRVKPPSEEFESFHSPRLNPAEGLEASATLFTAPPIESLELLRELGEIAAASFSETETFLGDAPAAEAPPIPDALPEAATPSAPPKAPQTSDERLMEALLEYHRLRGPKLGARTAPRPTANAAFSRVEASQESGDRFASVEIPVVDDFIPKTSSVTIRASRPVQTILKPKPRA